MFSPLTVVVPKPLKAISSADIDVVDVPATVVVDMYRFVPSFLNTVCGNPAPADRDSCGPVDDAMVRLYAGVVVDIPTKLFVLVIVNTFGELKPAVPLCITKLSLTLPLLPKVQDIVLFSERYRAESPAVLPSIVNPAWLFLVVILA